MIRYIYMTHRLESNMYNNSDKSGPGSNGNEGVLYIPQSTSIGVSPPNGLGFYSSADMQSVYSAAPDN